MADYIFNKAGVLVQEHGMILKNFQLEVVPLTK
jgi:hypothetical protein